MKSYNKRGCYKYGGTLKTKSVHGLKTGNHDNPNVLRAMRGHDGGSADGAAGRGSLSRPMRKRADGGRVRDERPPEHGFSQEPDAPNQRGPAYMIGAGIGTTIANSPLMRRFMPAGRVAGPLAKGIGYGLMGAGSALGIEEQARRERRDKERVERADGGRISDDSRREAARLRGDASKKSRMAGIQGGIGTIISTLPRAGGRAGHLFGKGVGALNLGAAVDNHFGGQRDHAEADRIERGLVEPGREDRKDGGKVEKKDWIAGATKNKGGLHRALKVPMGQKIPAAKIDKAAHSDNPKLAKQANLAKTLKGFK